MFVTSVIKGIILQYIKGAIHCAANKDIYVGQLFFCQCFSRIMMRRGFPRFLESRNVQSIRAIQAFFAICILQMFIQNLVMKKSIQEAILISND